MTDMNPRDIDHDQLQIERFASKEVSMADMSAAFLKRLAYAVMNINAWDLEDAGIITKDAKGGSDWTRFNRDIMTFILKLPPERLERLAALLTKMTKGKV